MDYFTYIAQTCRLCCRPTNDNGVLLFDNSRGVTVASLLSSVTGMQIEPNDELPRVICKSCQVKLSTIRQLIQLWQYSEKVQRAVFNKFREGYYARAQGNRANSQEHFAYLTQYPIHQINGLLALKMKAMIEEARRLANSASQQSRSPAGQQSTSPDVIIISPEPPGAKSVHAQEEVASSAVSPRENLLFVRDKASNVNIQTSEVNRGNINISNTPIVNIQNQQTTMTNLMAKPPSAREDGHRIAYVAPSIHVAGNSRNITQNNPRPLVAMDKGINVSYVANVSPTNTTQNQSFGPPPPLVPIPAKHQQNVTANSVLARILSTTTEKNSGQLEGVPTPVIQHSSVNQQPVNSDQPINQEATHPPQDQNLCFVRPSVNTANDALQNTASDMIVNSSNVSELVRTIGPSLGMFLENDEETLPIPEDSITPTVTMHYFPVRPPAMQIPQHMPYSSPQFLPNTTFVRPNTMFITQNPPPNYTFPPHELQSQRQTASYSKPKLQRKRIPKGQNQGARKSQKPSGPKKPRKKKGLIAKNIVSMTKPSTPQSDQDINLYAGIEQYSDLGADENRDKDVDTLNALRNFRIKITKRDGEYESSIPPENSDSSSSESYDEPPIVRISQLKPYQLAPFAVVKRINPYFTPDNSYDLTDPFIINLLNS